MVFPVHAFNIHLCKEGNFLINILKSNVYLLCRAQPIKIEDISTIQTLSFLGRYEHSLKLTYRAV